MKIIFMDLYSQRSSIMKNFKYKKIISWANYKLVVEEGWEVGIHETAKQHYNAM